jgi:hypothetical protein
VKEGKYSDKQGYEYGIEIQTQINIANELAEANRLKRIELQFLLSKGHEGVYIKELEDQV